jgi:uncharacterized protein involved in copper resistance
MKRTITGMALVLALVFTTTAWSQDSPMKGGKMGMGKMDMGESSKMKACMQMMGKMDMGDMEMDDTEMSDMDMGEMDATNAAVDELLGRMQAAEGSEKMAAMEELLTALVAQKREMQKMMRGMPKMMCGGMMRMMMQ